MQDSVQNSNQKKNDNGDAQDESLIQPAEFKPVDEASIGKKPWLKPVSAFFAVVFAVFVALLWYVFSARSVYIAFEPSVETLEITGGLNVKVGERYLLRQGDYQLSATATGYHPFNQTLTVTEEQNQTFRFNLRKLPGLLSVQSIPEQAVVSIDGEPVGQTPLEQLPVEPGEHRIDIVAERYLPESQSLAIEGRNVKQSMAVELTPAWSAISLLSSPAGAKVLVDGEPLGETPVTLDIMQGERVISLQLLGYKEWQRTLTVEPNQAQTLPEVLLEQVDGIVRITSRPSQANVTVNEVFRGQTPLTLPLAPEQNYLIGLFKPGYQAAKRSIEVKPGIEHQVAVPLLPIVADIKVISQPRDAMVYVNGKLRGAANQTFSLPTQRQKLELRKEGYVTYETYVTPRVGIEQQVKVRLKTLEQAKWEAIKTVITTGVGQKLKLFRPGPFTMGASRREAGRRSNEVLKKVNLSRAFYLSIKEVTNEQFRRYQKSHSSGHVQGNSLDGDAQPAVKVSWEQAALYCNWLSEQDGLPPAYRVEDDKVVGINKASTGYRMPTEAEWAWAARSSKNGLLKYPWGEQLPPTEKSGNYADRSAAFMIGRIVTKYNDSYAVTAPVGSFSPNHNGLYDMGGNVAEWVHDFYSTQATLSAPVTVDPLGPDEGKYHVIRGSSWAHGSITELRLSFRDYGVDGRNDLGFRIARFVE